MLLQYDPVGLALAVAVGLVGGRLLQRFAARAREEERLGRLWWACLAGIAGGATFWAANMLIVLALAGGDGGRFGRHVYDGATVALVMLGCVAAGVTLATVATLVRARAPRILANGLMGVLAVQSYFGAVASVRAAGEFVWNVPLAIGTEVLSCLGYVVLGQLARRKHGRWRGMTFTVALGLYVCGLVAMMATTVSYVPAPEAEALPAGMGHGTVTLLVAGVIGVMAAGGLAFAAIDRLAQQDAQARLRRLALHDALTGLPNRAQMLEELEALVAAGQVFALVAIDLDRFKPVNDVHGHEAGDALLCGAARAGAALLGPGESLARTGGDEFVAIRRGGDEAAAVAFAERLTAAFRRPVQWRGIQLAVGASGGVALHPRDGRTAASLLRGADLALYRAKEDDRDAVRVHDARMDERRRDRAAMAMELRLALERRQFELDFQPQTDLETGRPVGYEALIRWRHPERGRIPPNAFIPIAEATGLIRDIGAWVLHSACREAASWPAPLPVSVNVAPQQLIQADFVEVVRDALLAAGLPPQRLELEITEASVIADQTHARRMMEALKGLGVRIAMDDYGTGYASLATLRGFPFDRIKIDRSFIGGMVGDPQSIAIVRSTLLLGRALAIPVLAEGVASEREREFLRQEGCLEGQGFLFGRPASAEEARRAMLALVAAEAAVAST